MLSFSDAKGLVSHLVETEEVFPVHNSYWVSSKTLDTKLSKGIFRPGWVYRDSEIFTYYRNKYMGRCPEHPYNLVSPLRLFMSVVEEGCSYEAMRALAKHIKQSSSLIENNAFCQLSRKIDWKPGYFGETNNTSCWWNSKSRAMSTFYHNGGFAVKLFYDPELKRPMGRCWGVWIENYGLILFNTYYRVSPVDKVLQVKNGDYPALYADFLARKLSMGTRQINLVNKGRWDDTIHINNGTAYLISSDDILLNTRSKYDLEWTLLPSPNKCTFCSRMLLGNEFETDIDGRIACHETCVDKFFELCTFSMRWYIKDAMVTGPDNRRYALVNVDKVKEFVRDYRSNNLILKSEARVLSKIGSRKFYAYKDSDYSICKVCGNIIDGDKCRICERDREFKKRMMSKEFNTIDASRVTISRPSYRVESSFMDDLYRAKSAYVEKAMRGIFVREDENE